MYFLPLYSSFEGNKILLLLLVIMYMYNHRVYNKIVFKKYKYCVKTVNKLLKNKKWRVIKHELYDYISILMQKREN